ncbi:SagB/ThcOx family dehydrogenase [Streptomyces sp. JB150]|uniref:SagB/ThcOx family dehydrogenase n=1 Tax=Streptomyces sp. JB150 TaxID=2714844 RepID=UPI00140B33BE|nr:SagB/ThcOx family dehydrogenase [Streptomyces sp. JB150]QIJ66289.1 SagB/ThcOx family dehydrogenase [Streptomyces sp. JB150]
MDLVTALARARSAERPGPDTPAGPAVPDWPGPAHALPPATPGRLDLDRLLRLSLAAADPTGRLRPTPSAGALHPVDALLVVGDGCSLPPGRYGYDPLRHRVHHLGPAPHGTPPGTTVELTVTPRRTESHYGHRAWPLLLLDTGHATAALRLAAQALGTPRPDLRLDGTTESPLAAVHLPPPGAEPESYAPEHPGQEADEPPSPADVPTPTDLLTRRSAPPPLTGTPARDDLRHVLAAAQAAGAGRLRWCAAVGAPEPELVETAPDGTLRRLAAGEARPTLAVWAAGQRWLADAGAVLLAYGCPSDADAVRIRGDHLHAGHAVGRAQFAAGRRALAARPVGSWQRADLGAALGGAPHQNWIVHGLALGSGRPEKRTS